MAEGAGAGAAVSMTRSTQWARSATVTIDSPPVNLCDTGMFVELVAVVERIEREMDELSVITFRSAVPGYFIAHFDVEVLRRTDPDRMRVGDLNDFQRLCERIRRLGAVTIAEIDGRVGGGGCEIAMACDMRFASDTSTFNQPEVALGILPGGSGTVSLSSLVGLARAMEIVVGCDDVTAPVAANYGWINRSVPADSLRDTVDELAGRIAAFPPHAVKLAKAVLMASAPPRDVALRRENEHFVAALRNPASLRAMDRFFEAGGQTAEGETDLAGVLARASGIGPGSSDADSS